MPDLNGFFDEPRNAREIAGILPELFIENSPERVVRIAAQYGRAPSTLPEVTALFNFYGLAEKDKNAMVAFVSPEFKNCKTHNICQLFRVLAGVGRLTFSFPQWRFLTQTFSEPSLIESYGMSRLARSSDVNDSTLARSNPDYDRLGTGFSRVFGDWYVEYRRAYILCSNMSEENPATLVVRNSSYFFGRDRLDAVAYISWNRQTPDMLCAFDPDIAHELGYSDVVSAFKPAGDIPIHERLSRVNYVLDVFGQEDTRLSLWLSGEGFAPLNRFADYMGDKQRAAAKSGPAFYLAYIDATLPPWFPQRVLPAYASGQLDGFLNERVEGQKLVLLSGPNGDWPLGQVKAAPKPAIS